MVAMRKDITFEHYIYLKGFSTKGTSYHKIKADKGVPAFANLCYSYIRDGNLLAFQELINECKKFELELATAKSTKRTKKHDSK